MNFIGGTILNYQPNSETNIQKRHWKVNAVVHSCQPLRFRRNDYDNDCHITTLRSGFLDYDFISSPYKLYSKYHPTALLFITSAPVLMMI
jgi:hypothetical protein